MTVKERKALERAQKRLEKCGGNCKHCEKCHFYFANTERVLYMAVGCDLLPVEMFSSISDIPSQLHAAAIETVNFELGV